MVTTVKIKGDIKSQAVPLLLNSYSKLNNKGSPASWVCWSDDGKVYKHFAEACHASMYKDCGVDHIITAVPNSDAISLAYQRMLINGPFRAIADQISLERVEDKHYIEVSGLDKIPSSILFNYCIATRLPFEYRMDDEEAWQFDLLGCWTKYCSLGYNPTLAFLLSYSVKGQPNAAKRAFPLLGHFWFDVASDWRRILNGDPIINTPSFKDAPDEITPTNYIWGTAEDRNMGLIDMPKEAVSEFFGLPVEPLKALNKAPPKARYKKPNPWVLAPAQQALNGDIQQIILQNQEPVPQPQAEPDEQPQPDWEPDLGELFDF